MTLKHIDHLFQSNRYSLNCCLRKSPDWIFDEIEDLEREYGNQIWNPGRLLYAKQRNGSNGMTKTILPGNFYMFIYDPLLKHELPYFDILPLVLVFETGDGWFRGLNFHYLPQQARIQLLGHLMKYATTISPQTGKPILNDQTRILFDWEKVKDSPARSFVQPSEQKYLMNRARTDFKYINPLHWALMLLLPCEHFAKEDTETVWKDTVRKAMEVGKEHWRRKDPTVDFEKMVQNEVDSMRRDRKTSTGKPDA